MAKKKHRRKPTASEQYFDEQQLLAISSQAYRDALGAAKPDEDYMREARSDAAAGNVPVGWMSQSGFALEVLTSIAMRLHLLAREKGIEVDFRVSDLDSSGVWTSDLVTKSR